MRNFFAVLSVLGVLAFLSPAALADMSASLAFQSGTRGGQWQDVAVRLEVPVGAATILVQDARGGITVQRSFDSAVMEGTVGQSRIWVPLPLIAEADLPAGKWPLDVSVRAASGNVTRERVNASLGGTPAGGEAGANPLRIFIVGGTGGDFAWAKLAEGSPSFATCGQQDIVSGPALLFAGSDALVIPGTVAREMTAERTAALLNTGVRLVLRNDPSTLGAGAVLRRLAWVHVGAGSPGDFWISEASNYARPRVVEEGLAQARTLDVPAPVARDTLAAVLLTPVAALLILLLVRGLFHRRGPVLLALTVGLAGVAAGAVTLVRSNAKPATRVIAWSNRDGNSKGTSLRVTEKFTASTTLFTRQLRTDADTESLVFPVSASVRGYFALGQAVLSLDALSGNGLEQVSRLEWALTPRQRAIYEVRSATLLAGAPELSGGQWINGGYVSPANGPALPAPAEPGQGTIVADWAQSHPASRDAMMTWYELRFAGDHRYFMREPAEGDPLGFIDFGTVPASTAP